MKFKDLRTGEGFKYNNKLYIKLNLPMPAALDVKEGYGRVVKFSEDREIEKVVLDICITKCY